MISHKHKFIFTHINKCGGTTISNILRQYVERRGFDHDKLSVRIKDCIGDSKDYFKFTFVRNPWDKMTSFYHYHKRRKWDLGWPWDKNNSPEFGEFIKQIYDESFDWKPVFCGRQFSSTYEQKVPLRVSNSYMWLVDENDKLLTDFIGKIESFQEDFDIICDKIGIPQQQLPHKNKSKHKHYTEYYDDETKQIVAERCARDIEYFGYEFGE